jgi:nitronate monooxygenase
MTRSPRPRVETELSRRLSLGLPLIVAPMAGGPTTPKLVAASCEAGALGSLGAAYLSPTQIRKEVELIRGMTARSFAINLFTKAPTIELEAEQIAAARAATRAYRDELGLPDPDLAPPFHPEFERQLDAVLEARPAVFSFVFGLLDRRHTDACRARGILTMGTATTLSEGLALEESGVDAVVAQGVEAGGHRGIFDPGAEDPDIGILALTRSLAAKLSIPVVAAGGIMDGRGIAAALALGAQAAQMGTAFLLCDEAGTSEPYRRALEGARSGGDTRGVGHARTELTRAFSGRWARGIPNRFLNEMKRHGPAILPFPAQNAFTRDLRQKSAQAGSSELLSLWAGEGVGQIRPSISAAQLIDTLEMETEEAIRALAGLLA